MNSLSSNSQTTDSGTPPDAGFSPWQRLKTKKISYLTLPLLIMATITEFVILATGWKYQQVACLPEGMGVTFFGIGPIGATILAVELLKLPLAIWTSSRFGMQKVFMVFVGLPLICILTFQLVKDMAVYEMGVAMKPSSELLEKAAAQEVNIVQLEGGLAGIEKKKTDRELKLAELAARKTKAKADLDEALKRNSESRQDAISLTDYQKKELSEVDTRQIAITKQFDADAEKLTKAIADLRTRREVELGRATTWNAEEARIENAYKLKMADYENKTAAYEKALAEYNSASGIRRALMKEPLTPGVPPVRESNTIFKSAEITELDKDIKTKEAELFAVNSKRRDRVAQVDVDARKVREEFDRRSSTKREDADRKRDELIAANAALNAQIAAEEKQVDQEFQSAAQKVDGIRAEIDASRKRADGLYEAREASIKNTQVHRIATTVEIVRGLFMGDRPVSVTSTAKERGDIYTDQISMVRIWVYPVLAMIVAFLPTIMVEIGFSTVFHPEKQRPQHRLGFFGRRLHWLYTRAGRQKILRAERLASEASTAAHDLEQQLTAAKADAAFKLSQKSAETQAVQEALAYANSGHEEDLKQQEESWNARHASVVESLNRAVTENEELRDLQKAEVERQVQLRQNTWSERLAQLNKEWDEQRTASESERAAMIQEHHKKQLALSEECKAQVTEARRQLVEAERASKELSSKQTQELKEAVQAREVAESRLKHQTDTFELQLTHTKENAGREIEKAVRIEKQRIEKQQAELEKSLRHRDEDFDHRLKQREQELAFAFETRLAEEKTRAEDEARRREADVERQLEARAREVDARWNQSSQQTEATFQLRLKQQELQQQAQADVRLRDAQTEAQEQLRHRESDFERQLAAQSREAEMQMREGLQQKELAFHAQLKQREQELASRAATRESELREQWAADLQAREEAWEKQIGSRAHTVEARLLQEAQQKEDLFQIQLRQREQHLQSQFDARQAELQAKRDQELRDREQEWEHNAESRARSTEARLVAEMQRSEELFQTKLRQRDQQWQTKMDTFRTEWKAQAEQELHRREVEAGEARMVALREQEIEVRKEMNQKHETALAENRQREQDMFSQLSVMVEARELADRERDEAKKSATEFARQAHELKKKLSEASSFLSSWQNGSGLNEATGT